jgi:hypothetical protein
MLGAGDQFARIGNHPLMQDIGIVMGENLGTYPGDSASIIEACHRLIEDQFARHPQPANYAESLRLHLMQTSPGLRGIQNQTKRGTPTMSSSSTSGKACSHRCILCMSTTYFKSRGSLKRHISQKHHRNSVYYCPRSTITGCEYESTRLDKIRKHCKTQHHGFAVDFSLVDIPNPNFPISCNVCEVSPYFQSWDAWWQHIERHCKVEEGSDEAPKRSFRPSVIHGNPKPPMAAPNSE